jgi:GNAT superfamily N-acetyltransferase
MKQTIEIRPATADDRPRILELWKELMDFHLARDPLYRCCKDAQANFADFIGKSMAQADKFVPVASVDGRVVGYAHGAIQEYPPVFEIVRYGQLVEISVTQSCRRMGVGRRLVESILDWFRSHGLRRIDVRMLAANEVSTRFWAKQGFKPYLITSYRELNAGPSTEGPQIAAIDRPS